MKNVLNKLEWLPKDFNTSSRVTLLYESSCGNQVGGLPLVSVIRMQFVASWSLKIYWQVGFFWVFFWNANVVLFSFQVLIIFLGATACIDEDARSIIDFWIMPCEKYVRANFWKITLFSVCQYFWVFSFLGIFHNLSNSFGCFRYSFSKVFVESRGSMKKH